MALLLLSCAYGGVASVEINGDEFEVPDTYPGEKLKNDIYELEDVFQSCKRNP